MNGYVAYILQSKSLVSPILHRWRLPLENTDWGGDSIWDNESKEESCVRWPFKLGNFQKNTQMLLQALKHYIKNYNSDMLPNFPISEYLKPFLKIESALNVFLYVLQRHILLCLF